MLRLLMLQHVVNSANNAKHATAAVLMLTVTMSRLTWRCDWLRFLVQQAGWLRGRGRGKRGVVSCGRAWAGWRGGFWCRNQWNQFHLEQKQQQTGFI